jgi:hypothetical protein
LAVGDRQCSDLTSVKARSFFAGVPGFATARVRACKAAMLEADFYEPSYVRLSAEGGRS